MRTAYRNTLIMAMLAAIAGCVSSGDIPTSPSISSGATAYVGLMFPDSGVVGTEIVLRGHGFGTSAGNISLTIGGKVMAINSVRDGAITASIPQQATTGMVTLAVGGVPQDIRTFTVTDLPPSTLPSVCCFYPDSGRAGDTITMYGTNLTGEYAPHYIFFSPDNARIIDSVSSRSYDFIIPVSHPPTSVSRRIGIEVQTVGNKYFSPLFMRLADTVIVDTAKKVIPDSIEFSFGGITGNVEVVSSHENHETGRSQRLYNFGISGFSPAFESRNHGPNGIDTLRFASGTSFGPYDSETRTIVAVLNDAAGQIVSLRYVRERSGHSDGPLTSSKALSTWSNSDTIIFAGPPCTRGADGALECTVNGTALASYIAGAAVYGDTRNAVIYGDWTQTHTTFLGLLPIGGDAYLRFRVH